MFDNNLHAFQTDLQNGMSIEEALQKHNLTFKEVVSRMQDYQKNTVPKKESRYYAGKYLQKRCGCYYIKKE